MLNEEVRFDSPRSKRCIEQRTGTSHKIARYKCDDWTVTIGQISKTEECVTNELRFPMQAWDMYQSFSDSMKTLMRAMGPMGKNMEEMQEQSKKMKGFPLGRAIVARDLGTMVMP